MHRSRLVCVVCVSRQRGTTHAQSRFTGGGVPYIYSRIYKRKLAPLGAFYSTLSSGRIGDGHRLRTEAGA